MKKTAILYSEYLPVIDAILYNVKEQDFSCFDYIPNDLEKYDLIIDINFGLKTKQKVLKYHKSLLPAFKSDEPIKEAFLYGAKVTGVTFFFENPFEIIAQYPLLIKNDSHFDNTELEADYLIQTMFPSVIDKITTNCNIAQYNYCCNCNKGCTKCKK